MITNCQVCGNPIFGYKNMSLNKDGSINKDFCSNCYHFGHFSNHHDVSGQQEPADGAVPMTLILSNSLRPM